MYKCIGDRKARWYKATKGEQEKGIKAGDKYKGVGYKISKYKYWHKMNQQSNHVIKHSEWFCFLSV